MYSRDNGGDTGGSGGGRTPPPPAGTTAITMMIILWTLYFKLKKKVKKKSSVTGNVYAAYGESNRKANVWPWMFGTIPRLIASIIEPTHGFHIER